MTLAKLLYKSFVIDTTIMNINSDMIRKYSTIHILYYLCII